jgi:UDP-2,3-diacylglucosamine pyrophosphatase LpxH
MCKDFCVFFDWSYKNYFPSTHFSVIKQILKMLKNDTEVYYIPGNHDDFLREFEEIEIMNLHKLDKLILNVDGKKCWIFHGDVFDISMQGNLGKFLTKIGGNAYDFTIKVNRLINKFLLKLNRKPYSLSKKVKDSVKTALKYISDFENISCVHALKQNYDCVINGHIHQPCIKVYEKDGKSVLYMNSGDWIENLTSLEYNDVKWEIYKHQN